MVNILNRNNNTKIIHFGSRKENLIRDNRKNNMGNVESSICDGRPEEAKPNCLLINPTNLQQHDLNSSTNTQQMNSVMLNHNHEQEKKSNGIHPVQPGHCQCEQSSCHSTSFSKVTLSSCDTNIRIKLQTKQNETEEGTCIGNSSIGQVEDQNIVENASSTTGQLQQSEFTHHQLTKRKSFGRIMKRGSSYVLSKVYGSLSTIFESFDSQIFHRTSSGAGKDNLNTNDSRSFIKVHGGIYLHGCPNPEEHYDCIKKLISNVTDLRSKEGLKALGLEYRMVLCEQHFVSKKFNDDDSLNPLIDDLSKQGNHTIHDVQVELDFIGKSSYQCLNDQQMNLALDFSGFVPKVENNFASDVDNLSQISNFDGDEIYPADQSTYSLDVCNAVSNNTKLIPDFTDPEYAICHCHYCMRRLFHIETDTMIDDSNRKQFIADGEMYEVVSRLVQENAFDIMIEEGELQWISVENSETQIDHKPPIQVLLNSDHPLLLSPKDRQMSRMKDRPTLIVCTGRGKVRAGIFSRQHLICNGIEGSTCLPYVREAKVRNMNVFILDPNVRGEANGFTTFQKSLQYWCELCNTSDKYICTNSYILSHSASGGHLVRYLLDEDAKNQFMPFIEAIAFTDSSHNVQWAKTPEHKNLSDLLQRERSVYFRCGNFKRDTAINSQWYLHPAGEEIQTDTFWQHRFGTIKTMWAGTDEHSLTNWYSLEKIWEHFDQFLPT